MQTKENDGIVVNVKLGNKTATATPATSTIINNNTYSVKLSYSNGRVNLITVTGTFN